MLFTAIDEPSPIEVFGSLVHQPHQKINFSHSMAVRTGPTWTGLESTDPPTSISGQGPAPSGQGPASTRQCPASDAGAITSTPSRFPAAHMPDAGNSCSPCIQCGFDADKGLLDRFCLPYGSPTSCSLAKSGCMSRDHLPAVQPSTAWALRVSGGTSGFQELASLSPAEASSSLPLPQ